MSIVVGIVILIEALLALGIVFGFVHEDKVIAWVQATAREIRRRLCERWLNRGDLEARRVR